MLPSQRSVTILDHVDAAWISETTNVGDLCLMLIGRPTKCYHGELE